VIPPLSSKLVFLFGSGVSIPAGMPSTKDITDQVLSANNIMRHTDGNYYFGQPLYAHVGIPDEYVPRVKNFIEILMPEIGRYYNYNPERKTNYEDIYYVVSQIHDSELEELDNPVAQPFIDKIRANVESLLQGKEGETRKNWRLHELADETTHYIADIAWNMLSKKPNRLDYLNLVKDISRDNNLSHIDIFTLNHDTVLEQCLCQNNIPFNDGFGEPINGVRYWDNKLFETSACKIHLFKLHGSVDWFRLRPAGGGWYEESIGIPLNSITYSHIDKVDGRPLLLIGTFNKMLEYLRGIYTSLFTYFYKSLHDAERLVIIGYRFGDKGINTQIIQWLYSSQKNKITVIDPNPNLKNAARGAISNKWDNWINDDKLTFLQTKLEEISWKDIKNNLSI